jgi:hypothetical protein
MTQFRSKLFLNISQCEIHSSNSAIQALFFLKIHYIINENTVEQEYGDSYFTSGQTF